jgi:hypothetical protein
MPAWKTKLDMSSEMLKVLYEKPPCSKAIQLMTESIA